MVVDAVDIDDAGTDADADTAQGAQRGDWELLCSSWAVLPSSTHVDLAADMAAYIAHHAACIAQRAAADAAVVAARAVNASVRVLLEQIDMRARGGRDRDYTADADVKMLQALSENAAAIVSESEAALASLTALPPPVGTTPRQFATLRQLRW